MKPTAAWLCARSEKSVQRAQAVCEFAEIAIGQPSLAAADVGVLARPGVARGSGLYGLREIAAGRAQQRGSCGGPGAAAGGVLRLQGMGERTGAADLPDGGWPAAASGSRPRAPQEAGLGQGIDVIVNPVRTPAETVGDFGHAGRPARLQRLQDLQPPRRDDGLDLLRADAARDDGSVRGHLLSLRLFLQYVGRTLGIMMGP